MAPEAIADVAGSRMSFDLVGDSIGGGVRPGPQQQEMILMHLRTKDDHSTSVCGELLPKADSAGNRVNLRRGKVRKDLNHFSEVSRTVLC